MRLEDRCTVRCFWSFCVHECCWYQMAPICSKRRGLEPTGQPRLTAIVQSRRLTIFVHIARGCFQLSLLSRGLEETTRTPASHDWAMNTIGLIRMIRLLTSPKLKKCFFFIPPSITSNLPPISASSYQFQSICRAYVHFSCNRRVKNVSMMMMMMMMMMIRSATLGKSFILMLPYHRAV